MSPEIKARIGHAKKLGWKLHNSGALDYWNLTSPSNNGVFTNDCRGLCKGMSVDSAWELMSDLLPESIDQEPEYRKPPQGVMPEKLWLERRAQDLSRAIYEYAHEPHGFESKKELMSGWADEFKRILEAI